MSGRDRRQVRRAIEQHQNRPALVSPPIPAAGVLGEPIGAAAPLLRQDAPGPAASRPTPPPQAVPVPAPRVAAEPGPPPTTPEPVVHPFTPVPSLEALLQQRYPSPPAPDLPPPHEQAQDLRDLLAPPSPAAAEQLRALGIAVPAPMPEHLPLHQRLLFELVKVHLQMGQDYYPLARLHSDLPELKALVGEVLAFERPRGGEA
ncbi:hypothetical protein [Deinococcus multiflagellatus]|uniref:hypothetical protein n=1 Tax=Deinococcus multiflagellatus TaxID=1656887 RepID=UPI001CCC7031|nr:hypothetical protein [Deinococcus multiflagellatus]MBZ9715512.1 hypothetical protein [Deinococcus multiflagellatus]